MSNSTHPAVGIDLGTTFSVIARLDAAGRPETILNREGDISTPSAVLFEGPSIIVGKEALKAASMEPDQVATFAKRDMGSPNYNRPVNGKMVPPEVIQSLILEKLKQDAIDVIGEFEKCVVTVPAYFNEPRRKATQDAGQLANLDVMDIINEPTAAAIAYGRREGFLTDEGESRKSEKILVYDLGGGTFDVTVMEIDGRTYRTLATAGDVYLGGIDWDRRIADYIAEIYQAKHRVDPRQNPAGLQRLLREAEDAKRSLSAREQITITFEHAGEGVRVPLTRQDFEAMGEDLIQRTLFTTRSVLTEADLKWDDLTRILLVGGSTRMPAVVRALEEESGIKTNKSLSADEAVGHGAAIYAGMLLAEQSGVDPKETIQNVNSHDLGILATDPETGRRRSSVMIRRNTTLPARKRRRFKTAKDDQRSVVAKVIEGGDSSGNNSTRIGKCVIKDLPEGLPKGTPVDVSFSYQENGRLIVEAQLPTLSKAASLDIERASGLSQDSLKVWGERLQSPGGPLDFAD